MQRAIADMGGAEIAAGFTQRGAGLFAVALIQRRIELGAGLLEPVDSRVEVLVDLNFCSGGSAASWLDGHLGDVGGEDGQIAHGRPPHWYARVKLGNARRAARRLRFRAGVVTRDRASGNRRAVPDASGAGF